MGCSGSKSAETTEQGQSPSKTDNKQETANEDTTADGDVKQTQVTMVTESTEQTDDKTPGKEHSEEKKAEEEVNE